MENIPEYELNTSFQHRDGLRDGKLRKLTTVLCLNSQNQLWTKHRMMSKLNGELNETLSRELDMLGIDLG